MRCPFCQNYEVSRAKRGKAITPSELADIFKKLEDDGADNISLVTPTHATPYLLRTFEIYRPKIPVVYNTSGYDKVSTLQDVDEFIDIYLPDCKFYSPTLSARYLGKPDYFERASEAIAFMSQKPCKMTADGKMLSGLIVRHLVMPLCASDSKAIVKWFASNLPKTAYLSLMRQYTPIGENANYPELNRKITSREYESVVETALSLGIENLFLQDKESAVTDYIPRWDY